MAIKVNDGFQLGSSVAVDSRLVLTLEEMASMNDAIMPDVYVAICKTDKSLYLYSKENTVNETTGKFRKFEGGNSKIWSGTREEYEAQKETIPEGSLIIITDEEGESAMIHWIGTSAQWAAEDKTAIPNDTVVIITDDTSEGNAIVTEWSATPSNEKVPSEKLVKDSINDVYTAIRGKRIKKALGAGTPETGSLNAGEAKTVTIDLTSYGFTKAPLPFLRSTWLCSAAPISITTTSMSVSIVNLYPGARTDCSATFILMELE